MPEAGRHAHVLAAVTASRHYVTPSLSSVLQPAFPACVERHTYQCPYDTGKLLASFFSLVDQILLRMPPIALLWPGYTLLGSPGRPRRIPYLLPILLRQYILTSSAILYKAAGRSSRQSAQHIDIEATRAYSMARSGESPLWVEHGEPHRSIDIWTPTWQTTQYCSQDSDRLTC